eukprot:scaffold4177_cov425-Prasinococcus_capsulatus_cf.AAC.2
MRQLVPNNYNTVYGRDHSSIQACPRGKQDRLSNRLSCTLQVKALPQYRLGKAGNTLYIAIAS